MAKGMDQSSQWKQAFLHQRPLVQQVMVQARHCDTKIKTLAYGFVLILGFNFLPLSPAGNFSYCCARHASDFRYCAVRIFALH